MTNNKPNYGLNLTGVTRVFRKDKTINSKGQTFTISDVWFNTSEKDEQGNWKNISTNLIFPKGIEPPLSNSVIEIIEAFPMVNGKGQYARVVYYVKGWHYAPGYPVPQQQGQQAPPQQNYNNQQPPQGGYNNGQQNYNNQQGYNSQY